MQVTEQFSKGLDILKGNMILAVPLVAAGIIGSLLSHFVIGSMNQGYGMMGMGGFDPGMFNLGTFLGAALIVWAGLWVINAFASGMTYIMADTAGAGEMDLNQAFQKVLGNIVNLLVVSFLVGLLVIIGIFLLILPGLAAAFLLMFAIPLVVLENKSPIEALQNSVSIVLANLGETIVFAIVAIVVLIITSIIGGIFSFIPFLGSLLISPLINGAAWAYVSVVLILIYKELQK